MADADAEIERGLDAIETACAIGNEMFGVYMTNQATEVHTLHEPLVSAPDVTEGKTPNATNRACVSQLLPSTSLS